MVFNGLSGLYICILYIHISLKITPLIDLSIWTPLFDYPNDSGEVKMPKRVGSCSNWSRMQTLRGTGTLGVLFLIPYS